METRSKDVLALLGGTDFYKREPMNLSMAQQLPTHRYFYERYLTILKLAIIYVKSSLAYGFT